MGRHFHRSTSRVLCAFVFLSFLAVNGEGIRCILVDGTKTVRSSILCKCQEAKTPPWKDNVKPAVCPQNGSISFNRKNQPNIQWTQRGQYESGRFVYYANYSVEVTVANTNYVYYCVVNSEKLNQRTNSSTVTFFFKDCCKSMIRKKLWHAGKVLYADIDAVPMYNKDDDPKTLSLEGTFPDTVSHRDEKEKNHSRRIHATNSPRRTTPSVQDNGQTYRKENGPYENASGQPLQITVAVLGTALFCCILFGTVLCFMKNLKKKKKKCVKLPNRKVLLVGDLEEENIKFINEFTEILKKKGSSKTEVISSARKTSEVSSMGIVLWATENINGADVVVLILTDSEQIHQRNSISISEKIPSCSHVGVALRIAQTIALRSGFPNSKNKFIVLDVTNSIDKSQLPYCSLYSLRNGTKSLLKRVLHDHLIHRGDDLDKDVDLLQRLASAEGVPFDDSETKCDTIGLKLNNLTHAEGPKTTLNGNLAQPSEQNDLDHSILYSHSVGKAPSTQYISIENNEERQA